MVELPWSYDDHLGEAAKVVDGGDVVEDGPCSDCRHPSAHISGPRLELGLPTENFQK